MEFGAPKKVLTSLEQIDPETLESLAQWIENRGMKTTIGQVVGYQRERLVSKVDATLGVQSVPSGVPTPIVFQNTRSDEQKVFNGTTTFTLPYNGVYIVSGIMAFNGVAGTYQSNSYILNNGVVVAGDERVASATNTGPRCTMATVVVGGKGDLITHTAFQNSGSSLTIFEASFEIALLNTY